MSVARDMAGSALSGPGSDAGPGPSVDANFERLFEAAPDAMVGVAAGGSIRLVNRQAELLFGYDRADLVGEAVEILVPERFRGLHPRHRHGYESDPRTRPMSSGFDLSGRRRDGSEFPVDISLSSIETPGGLMVIAAVRDISQRRRQEDALHRLTAIVESSDDAIVSTSLGGRILTWNHGAERLYGYPATEAIGQPVSLLTPSSQHDEMPEILGRIAAGERVVHYETTRRRLDGTVVEVSLTVSPVHDVKGVLVGASTIARDISDRKRAEADLRTTADASWVANERFRRAFEDAPIGMALTHPDGRLFQVNRSLCELLGRPPRELLSATLVDLTHPDDRDFCARAWARLAAGEVRRQRHEQRLRHADGSTVWVVLSVSMLDKGAQSPSYCIAQFQDVTASKQAQSQLIEQALHDQLTGLPNRALIKDRVAEALLRSERNHTIVAVLFADLDRFKLVNDSLGHEAGDSLLMAVADRFREVLRQGDTAGRLGGDEFVLVCEGLHQPEEAVAIAERVADALARPFEVEGRELTVASSVGIALSGGSARTADDLIRDADVAMYGMKQRGGAGFEMFDEGMRLGMVKRLEIEAGLRRAVRRGELRVYYQPIVAVGSGVLAGVEALMRWQDPDRGLREAAEFIPVAEVTSLIGPIGHWALNEACRRAAEWSAARPELTLSLNLSARQAAAPDLVDIVKAALDDSGLDPRQLCLEITESSLIVAPDTIAAVLWRLRRIGVQLSIDDFGTGYASLSYLTQFKPDLLKVDRSFVGRLGHDPESTAVVTAVIGLAHSLGLLAVGEGVETLEQLALLRRLGCDQAQGYLFSPALPAGDIDDLLRRGEPYLHLA